MVGVMGFHVSHPHGATRGRSYLFDSLVGMLSFDGFLFRRATGCFAFRVFSSSPMPALPACLASYFLLAKLINRERESPGQQMEMARVGTCK